MLHWFLFHITKFFIPSLKEKRTQTFVLLQYKLENNLELLGDIL